MKKKNIVTIVIAVLFICVCAIFSLLPDKEPAAEIRSATQIAEIQPTERPAATAVPQSPALIPGILPADVTINLENRSLICADVSNLADYYVRTCKKDIPGGMLFVEIYGKQLLTVDAISATITQSTVDNSLTADFLGFVATIPFVDNSSLQDQAKAWAEQTAPLLTGETNINGIAFQISGLETAVTLDIGNIK